MLQLQDDLAKIETQILWCQVLFFSLYHINNITRVRVKPWF